MKAGREVTEDRHVLGSASGAADTVTPRALTRQGTAAASEGQEAAAGAAAGRIVDETLEKVRARQDINKIALLVGRNPEKMTALMVLKKPNPQKKNQKAVTELHHSENMMMSMQAFQKHR